MTTITEPARISVDECWDRSPNHPTDIVRSCSPDPVLTHDGATSQACRRCACGRSGTHVVGCTAGLGPPPPLTDLEKRCIRLKQIFDELVGMGAPQPVRQTIERWTAMEWPHPDKTIVEFLEERK